MPDHYNRAYHDGQRWIVYCEKCSLEDDQLQAAKECSERYVKKDLTGIDRAIDKTKENT